MLKTTTALTAAALLLLTTGAQAGNQKSSSAQTARASVVVKAAKPTRIHASVPKYLDVAGFKGSVRDPRYAYASVRAPAPARTLTPQATVSQFPMPNAVWW